MRWDNCPTCSKDSYTHAHIYVCVCDYQLPSLQVPVSKFHELRYNVTFVLKEMEDLEKRNILKLQD